MAPGSWVHSSLGGFRCRPAEIDNTAERLAIASCDQMCWTKMRFRWKNIGDTSVVGLCGVLRDIKIILRYSKSMLFCNVGWLSQRFSSYYKRYNYVLFKGPSFPLFMASRFVWLFSNRRAKMIETTLFGKFSSSIFVSVLTALVSLSIATSHRR